MIVLIAKATGIWCILVLIAIINALVRENWLAAAIGSRAALPLSGLLLSLYIFIAAFLAVPFFNASTGSAYVTVGVSWVVLTLAFELVFGHYVAGKSWRSIIGVFNVMKGDLFSIALLAALVSPWVSAKIRGLI